MLFYIGLFYFLVRNCGTNMLTVQLSAAPRCLYVCTQRNTKKIRTTVFFFYFIWYFSSDFVRCMKSHVSDTHNCFLSMLRCSYNGVTG